MDKQSMLIAEINAEGGIAWLWRVDPGKRPKIVKDKAGCLRDIDDVTTHGATKEDIEIWLRSSSLMGAPC